MTDKNTLADGNNMKKIILDIWNTLFADAMCKAFFDSNIDFNILKSNKTENTVALSYRFCPDILIMEVTRYHPFCINDRLKICNKIKQELGTCKIVFLVDENSEKELAAQVRQAKRDGLIDEFIYGSISATYLAALMDAL